MIIAVASGKGGTGKTTVAAGLADLAAAERRLVLADADVDAANLELLLAPSLLETHEFVAGEVAAIDAQACIGCGRCAEACRFGAIGRDPAGGAYRIDPGACEGCAACYYVCPEAAVVLSDRHSGRWFASQTRYGPLLHAHLFAGQENSGKLVTRLRQEAMVRANESGADLVVVDGPPGIGCPVIAAVSGVDLALMVTEPSVSGLHDLERILGVAQHFRVPAVVVVNKADLNPARTREVESFCASRGIPVIGRLPYDAAVITWLTRASRSRPSPRGRSPGRCARCGKPSLRRCSPEPDPAAAWYTGEARAFAPGRAWDHNEPCPAILPAPDRRGAPPGPAAGVMMNSRERVTAAIARQPVDRVPLGLYAVDHDTVERVIGRPTYVRNKIATQIALWEGRRAELAESLKADTVEFYRKIDCADIILPKEPMVLPPADYEPDPPKQIGENRWEDRRGRIFQAEWRANEIQCVYDPTPPPSPDDYNVAQFEGEVEVKPADPSVFEVWDYVYAALGEERYVASPTPGITALTRLGDTQTGLMLYALKPEVVHAANRRAVDRQNAQDPHYIRSQAPGVLVEQDMAGSNGPLVSPSMFREFCLPYLRERVQHIKQYTPQVILHNCGNNIPLMDQFIETGIDCYQSLQTTAGMEVGLLKERYGHALAFWGGVSVEKLIEGTPEDVRQAVRQALERGRGPGFILGPSHSVAMNTRYDNFMAMLDEFEKLRDRYV